MSLEQTEEEQVEALKTWLRKNGSAMIIGLALGLAAIGGYRFWVDYQAGQSQKASMVYSNLQNYLISGDSAGVFAVGRQLVELFPGTPYAALAALGMARMSVESNSFDAAEVHLRWVIKNANEDGLKHIARLRLARVLATEKKYDEALALVKQSKLGSYTSLYSEIRGDILLAKKQLEQARSAYQQALNTLAKDDRRRALIEMKINNLPAIDSAQS
ncbi:MAG: tetratricopeptide repeat protein [Gammaproteobacteria bacterium]|nr:tetratricopeptide repeat protein [Gammaproteobacteria bacterium]